MIGLWSILFISSYNESEMLINILGISTKKGNFGRNKMKVCQTNKQTYIKLICKLKQENILNNLGKLSDKNVVNPQQNISIKSRQASELDPQHEILI
ncbi:CLUMA_CG017605, isoform A [Clunio marinus]|uniref:CLUMA_CG017605, isoform A n=1 Tax=Clunio marinus TaxID=568069 RepID=A0A1J1IXT6_9DIPT|nr:CLUMA_CG017605, isoform A [Clunio marinus]